MSTSAHVPFDDAHRRLLFEMVTDGASVRTAAKRIGLSPDTLAEAIQREPSLRLDLLQAEHALEKQALQLVYCAARNPRYWRAAAWLLERKNQDDFGRRRSSEPGPNQRTLDRQDDAFQAIIEGPPPDLGQHAQAGQETASAEIRTAGEAANPLGEARDRVADPDEGLDEAPAGFEGVPPEQTAQAGPSAPPSEAAGKQESPPRKPSAASPAGPLQANGNAKPDPIDAALRGYFTCAPAQKDQAAEKLIDLLKGTTEKGGG